MVFDRIRSAVYTPGTDVEGTHAVLGSDADALVADLEDTVVPVRKDEARASVRAVLTAAPGAMVIVRLNPVGGPHFEADAAAVRDTDAAAFRLAKVESRDDVLAAVAALGAPRPLQCLIESARGVENAAQIAHAHPAVASLLTARVDLSADLGTADESTMAWCEGRVLVAARAAGLTPPPQGVYVQVDDIDGLRRSCRAGRARGFFGRSATHLDQVPVINETWTPTRAEIALARTRLAGFEQAVSDGVGKYFQDGRLVDNAVIRADRLVLDLADRVGVLGG